MTYKIEKVAALMGAHCYGAYNGQVRWLLTDSRSLSFPEETLFFAIKTSRNDGHRYIGELYRRGVRAFVVEQSEIANLLQHENSEIANPLQRDEAYPGACFLVVNDTRKALQRLAECHRDEFDIPIVGITGSNGKTVVKEWLYQLLREDRYVVRSPRSYNSQIGVPLSVWLLNENTQLGIIEAGISQKGEMQALRDIIQPTVGVFTTLGPAHQENFQTMEEKCLEKMRLFKDAQSVVCCLDDEMVVSCLLKSGFRGEVIGWRMRPSESGNTNPLQHTFQMHPNDELQEMTVMKVTDTRTVDGNRTQVTYIYKGIEGTFTLPFLDEASIRNTCLCAVTALHLGLAPDVMAQRMARLAPVAMRMEVKEGQRGCLLINDSYNNDVESLDIALDFAARRNLTTLPSGTGADEEAALPPLEKTRGGLPLTLILSDIYQSGKEPNQLYAEVSRLAVSRGIGKFIGIGPDISLCQDQIAISQKYFFDDTQQFVQSDVFRQLQGELILLKGSRRFGFDRITELLEKKVHETILEVNLNAVVDNLNYYRSFLRPETKMVCMIKADAYGAGAVEIAKTLQDHRVDYLAVAVADEGVTLRKAGITANIMVMNPEMTAFKTLFDYRLEPEVYSFRLLDALIRAARKEGITGWPVHVKLDTGMHRLGFNASDEEEMKRLVHTLRYQQAVIPRSVFSHFVGSDSDDFDDFSALQFSRFDRASQLLQSSFQHKILRHIDNSAGIEHFPERQLDMCRLGLGLYGVNPRNNEILHTVSTLKTTILQMRHVAKEDTVGYSRRGVLTRDSVIAAIPIGYADGLNRHLGRGRCYCLVNGQRAPYVGNICMDVAMIDVTDIPCQEGDTVEIFGDHLPVTVLSDCLDTIPYEVLTGISNRVKRVYYQEG